MFYRFLRLILLIVSCGFYTLHVNGAECPGHPRSKDEIADEQREKDPANRQKREFLDEIEPERAPHSPQDADNFASPPNLG